MSFDVELPEMIVTVQVDGKLVSRNLSEDLKADMAHIDVYLQRAPGLTAYWNMLYEKQRSITHRSKVAVARKHAELDKHVRKMAAQDGRKAAKDEVEAEILVHPEYQKEEEVYLTNRETELTLKGAVEAIKELRSTLISLSANMRSSGNVPVARGDDREKAYLRKYRK